MLQFVEFEDTRDAQDAVRDYDGKMLNGRPVKIEISTGTRCCCSFRPAVSSSFM
jgi:RNA recognition motif-containing protein